MKARTHRRCFLLLSAGHRIFAQTLSCWSIVMPPYTQARVLRPHFCLPSDPERQQQQHQLLSHMLCGEASWPAPTWLREQNNEKKNKCGEIVLKTVFQRTIPLYRLLSGGGARSSLTQNHIVVQHLAVGIWHVSRKTQCFSLDHWMLCSSTMLTTATTTAIVVLAIWR